MDFAKVYDDIPVGVCILRRDRKDMGILYSNRASLVFEEAWLGGKLDDFSRKLKSPGRPDEFSLSIEENNGKIHWIKILVSEGAFVSDDALFLWITDISAGKEEESRLQYMLEKADTAAEMKANFLATMSHEIRTPMQSVYGLLELIGEERSSGSVIAMVDTAKASASGLLEILDDILDFAKIDAEKMELDVFEVPVRTLVRGIIEALVVKVHGRKVILVDDIEDDVPFVIVGDPKRLRQVLMNLMGNALKFTETGSVTVRVKVKDKASDKTILCFEVIDTGIGMSEETASRLFNPFTQADSSTSRKFGGTGLGLSISKRLVELMGGRIGVESKEGRGSTFWFEIPTEEVSTDATTIELPSLDGLSVLSVEDHPQGAREIVRSLQSMGASVDSVPSCREGMELVLAKPYDVGVIDQGLSDGLGLDLIREIMEIRPFMGLVMYTVRDDIGLAHSLQSLGVKYLTKPASRAGLGEAVKDAAQALVKMSIEGPQKLLIAEDTESVRYVLGQQLRKLGVKADFVSDGKEAIEALDSGEYGILFTDLHMPGMDGFEVMKYVRSRDKVLGLHFPVVALTADVYMAQRHIYISHGFDECLLKPVTMGQFRRLLIRWGLLSENKEMNDRLEADDEDDVIEKPPAIDRKVMVQLMGAFDESSVEMLGLFVEMTEPAFDEMKEAMENDDYKGLEEIAHSLKGASRSACANVLGDIAEKIQLGAAKEEDCSMFLGEVLDEFERVRHEVDEMKRG